MARGRDGEEQEDVRLSGILISNYRNPPLWKTSPQSDPLSRNTTLFWRTVNVTKWPKSPKIR